ncbi:MAG: recombination protein RecR [Candidatus Colwellbacteria bacterium CG10_big_fil_rev_8_21_14_0_10_41_28]|uniref:Recombination protein RecR n=1 Tax=Candidatus Colwellbacteria bacterium CG10_big_fil_rev_8_21_14_0_10_41_28 TaxID=1974539 RepID=A0A2H0VHH0_9BACT|nr:MAG: recombination protein RecR [Candidatus Colwellbacteria bacterium CG10_big_fil_rev_8_21_14_0_10_41_28]
MRIPKEIRKLADALSSLPGIGPRQGIRLAFHLIKKGEGFQKSLADDIKDLSAVKICSDCFYIHSNPGELCEICSDPDRDKSIIAIVEKDTDLTSMENASKFNGTYLVLGEFGRGGSLEPDQKLKIKSLRSRIKRDGFSKAKEIVIALNPNPQNNFLSAQIEKELDELAERITRLGVGIPSGGEIEFADEDTLGGAIEHRR